jgi:hypothetical protein
MGIEVARLNDGDFAAEVTLAVIAIAGRLLTVGGDAVTDDFMGHASVTDKLDSQGRVFDNSLMTTLDDPANERLCAAVLDFVLRLVTDTSGFLDLADKLRIRRRINEFHGRIDDFHISFSLQVPDT